MAAPTAARRATVRRHAASPGADPERGVEQRGQLAQRHAVADGNGELAHERSQRRIEHRPFHPHAAQRIGTVGHHDGNAGAFRRAHHPGQRVRIGVEAGAHVLDVEHQHVDAIEHRRRGFAVFAVQAVHGQAGGRIARGGDVITGLHVTAHAVFGTEQRDQREIRMRGEAVDITAQLAVQAGGIGHQPHAPAAQQVQALLQQHLDAQLRPRACSRSPGQPRRAAQGQDPATAAVPGSGGAVQHAADGGTGA